uniref:Serpentine receptor class gamma n=1 Tax=Strongyloides stercoralis TaxID=6248 RepID=A0A913IBL6_STRER
MLENSFTGILLKIYFGFCFIIDIFSFVLYILILFFIGNRIIKKDKFYFNGFYKLIFFNGFLDLIFIVKEYIIFRIPQYGFFENFYINIFPELPICRIFSTSSLAQVIFATMSGITITFNRYIAIKYPTKYNYIWSGWRLILLCTWPLLISVPVFVIFFEKKMGYRFNQHGGLVLYYKDLYLNKLILTIVIIIHLTGLCINIILNVLLVYTVKKLDIVSKIINNRNREMKLEITMVKFAIVYCTFFAIVVFTEICILIAAYSGSVNVAEDILIFCVFIKTGMVFFTPYTLLFLSSDFRRKFLFFFGFSKLSYIGNKNKILIKSIKTPTNVFKFKVTILKN